MNSAPEWLSNSEAADVLGFPTVAALNQARYRGEPLPPEVRISPRRIRYRRSVVEAWLESRTTPAT